MSHRIHNNNSLINRSTTTSLSALCFGFVFVRTENESVRAPPNTLTPPLTLLRTSAPIVDVAKIPSTILTGISPQRDLLIHLLLTWPLREKEISVSLESWSYLLAYMRCDDTASTGLSPDMFSYSFCFRIWRWCAWAIRIGPRMVFHLVIRAEWVSRGFVPCGRMKEQWDKEPVTFSSKHFHWYSIRLTNKSYDRSTPYSNIQSPRQQINTIYQSQMMHTNPNPTRPSHGQNPDCPISAPDLAIHSMSCTVSGIWCITFHFFISWIGFERTGSSLFVLRME